MDEPDAAEGTECTGVHAALQELEKKASTDVSADERQAMSVDGLSSQKVLAKHLYGLDSDELICRCSLST